MAKRPNLLLIMADQLAPQVLPAYGHPRVRTPNLDRLAAQGVVFENAYCNFPLCAPARFSMLSGQLPSRIGAYDNAAETWDVPALDRAVRESQAARRLVSEALRTGARTPWDFQPVRDASKAYSGRAATSGSRTRACSGRRLDERPCPAETFKRYNDLLGRAPVRGEVPERERWRQRMSL